MNCFGMSELSGPETYTNPLKWKNFRDRQFLKEAGKVIDGLTISIDNPDNDGNGEICLRGNLSSDFQVEILSWDTLKMSKKLVQLLTAKDSFIQVMLEKLIMKGTSQSQAESKS